MRLRDYSEWLTPERLEHEEREWQKTRLHVRNADFLLAFHPSSVLELCCGTGLVAERIAAAIPTVEYSGIDKNPHCIAAAIKRNPALPFRCADIREARASADAVVIFAALKHFAEHEWGSVFRRVLSMGKRLAVFDIHVSHGADFVETGTEWPHVWVPEAAIARCTQGWRKRAQAVTLATEWGTEELRCYERVVA